MSLSEVPPGSADGPLGAAGRVLVSDADRARMADVIGDAYAEGRLNRDEYEERLTATLGARTAADLVPVLDGLPAGDRRGGACAPDRDGRWPSPDACPGARVRLAPARGRGLVLVVGRGDLRRGHAQG